MSQPEQKNIVLITGMSGAGRSSALKILEDMGYDAIDNLPLLFLPSLIKQTDAYHHIAIGIDVRSHNFGPQRFRSTIDAMKAIPNYSFRLLYLECDDDVLQRRFTETRRRHPISGDLLEAIKAERSLISPLKNFAHEVVDTSVSSPIAFQQLLRNLFDIGEYAKDISFHLTSFSYRHGVPRQADLMIDTRCLTNPFYEPSLSEKDGRDSAVQEFLKKDELWDEFTDSAKQLITLSVKGFTKTSRSYVTIACGCTGGQHRSVFLAEELCNWLISQGYTASLEHRELSKDS